MSDQPDKLITNPAVARLFSVAPRTIFNWVLRPKLNFPRPLIIGARRYFSLAEILVWKDSHILGAAPPPPASPSCLEIVDPIPPRMTKRRIEAKPSLIDRENASEVEAREA